MTKTTLDLKGLSCPLPVLRANKAARKMNPGDVIEVLVTDPDAPKDFEAYCETSGHQLVERRDEADCTVIVLRLVG